MRKRTLLLIVFSLLFFIGSILAVIAPEKSKKAEYDLANTSTVSRICELATLRCYYHNVAEFEDQPALFQYGLFRYGYRHFFLEYSGIVEVGVDAGEIIINPPDENNVVGIVVPEARILNISADKDTITNPESETGLFTSVDTEDIADAFAEAQRNMKQEAGNDQVILRQARENAKELLKQYVLNIGNLVGKQYKVKWVES